MEVLFISFDEQQHADNLFIAKIKFFTFVHYHTVKNMK